MIIGIIIILIIAFCCCCLISVLGGGGYYYYGGSEETPAETVSGEIDDKPEDEPESKPPSGIIEGSIGAPCIGTEETCDSGLECKFGICFEKCEDKGDCKAELVPRKDKFYCDYTGCETEPKGELKEEPKSAIKPRPTSMADCGYPQKVRGWFDMQGQGVKNDFCRYVGDWPGYFSCQLAGTTTNTPKGEYPDSRENDPHDAYKGEFTGHNCKVVPSNLVPLVNKYSSRMGDSCAGRPGQACHDDLPESKFACMAPDAVSGTVPLKRVYINGDTCVGTGDNPCGAATSSQQATIGHVWTSEVNPGQMVQLYRGYSQRMNDTCLGVEGTACHDAGVMKPTGNWAYKPEHC